MARAVLLLGSVGCQNPCKYRSLISFREVLDPASKAAVLSVDSQIQMRGTIEGEFQVWKGGLGSHAS